MIVRKQTIRFSPDRTPMPKKVKIGYESDNMVERLVFVLPDIAESQTATMMMDGEYANMVTLERSDEDDRYFANMTADRVGAAGEIECYIVIDGENGEVWNSGTFYLATGEVPAVNEELAERYPDAIEQMRTEMASHRVEMEEQTEAVGDLVADANEAARIAADGAVNAQMSADRAQEAVTSSGYVFFDIDDAGHLIMTKTENVNKLDFGLNNGRLEVLYG